MYTDVPVYTHVDRVPPQMIMQQKNTRQLKKLHTCNGLSTTNAIVPNTIVVKTIFFQFSFFSPKSCLFLFDTYFLSFIYLFTVISLFHYIFV